jgi:hypothetical protein
MKIKVPQNSGNVRVAMTLGNKFTVWNGKQGQHEFTIVCRNRKQATELVKLINEKKQSGEPIVEVDVD